MTRVTRVSGVRTAAVTRAAALILLTGALSTGLAGAAAPASACTAAAEPTVRPGSPERDTLDAREADAVVVGTVVADYAPPIDADRQIASVVYTLEVDAVLKGTATRLERVLMSTSLATACGGGGSGSLVRQQRMVVFLRALSPPTLGARYGLGSGSRPVASAADVHFPGAVAASPLPGGSIATANNTPGVRSWAQSPVLIAALIAVGVTVVAVVLARVVRPGRNTRRPSRG